MLREAPRLPERPCRRISAHAPFSKAGLPISFHHLPRRHHHLNHQAPITTQDTCHPSPHLPPPSRSRTLHFLASSYDCSPTLHIPQSSRFLAISPVLPKISFLQVPQAAPITSPFDAIRRNSKTAAGLLSLFRQCRDGLGTPNR